jgi:multicomponent Na+:H+ antiporter subunit G
MNPLNMFSIASLVLGSFFFLAGTTGLLRFPDVYTRLHALTKADNLGLALVALGVAVQAESWLAIAKIILVWALIMLSSTTCAHLVSRAALAGGIEVWRRSDDE